MAQGVEVDRSLVMKRRRDGRVVLAWIVGFFATFIVVDAYMVWVAVSTQTGTVIDAPYERGLAYDKVIRAAEDQAKLGWQAKVTVDPAQRRLLVRVVDRAGAGVVAPEANVTFFRPVQAGQDVTEPLIDGPDQGGYTAKIPENVTGYWRMRVYIKRDQEAFVQEQDFTFK